MKLTKLHDEPLRIEGRFGTVIIEPDANYIAITTLPDTGCQSRIPTNALPIAIRYDGHKVILEKR